MSPNTVVLDSGSESDSDSGSGSDNGNIILEDPMYQIMTKLFKNDQDENIATILTNLTKELVLLRIAIIDSRK